MKFKILTVVFLLQINLIFATNYYVDGSVSTTGNGLSWATAWKTISEATSFNLQAGDCVYIKNGTYVEGLYLNKSGSEIVPITSGISISNNRIYFPPTTDLSTIDLTLNPDEYYIYIYRSWKSNNGFFKIMQVNNLAHYIEVQNPDFINETGTVGDFYALSASIGQPIIFKNGSSNPQSERVLLDVSTTNIYTIAALGNFYDPNNSYDAYPIDYNIIDGIDLTGSKQGGGWHIQCSNFNVITNCKVYNTGTVSLDNAGGILINGNETRTAKYNIIINNEIFNTPYEAIYIGAGGHPQYNNHTNFNHIIGNKLYTQGNAPNAKMENAVDIKEFNYGNVVESNIIGDFQLSTIYNGAIDVVHDAHHTLVYNNTLKNITKGNVNDVYFTISVNENADSSYIYNNLIYNQVLGGGLHFAFYLACDNNTNSYVCHNTVYNYANGILTASGGIGFTVANNIIVSPNPIEAWSEDFIFSNNLYTTIPNYFLTEPNRKVGNPNFEDVLNNDFRLTAGSTLAIDSAVTLTPVIVLDKNLYNRSNPNDIGAYEYGSIILGVNDFEIYDFEIYPNPATDKITIYCSLSQNLNLYIYSIVGGLELHRELDNPLNEIDISTLTNGMYIIKVTGSDWTLQRKFVKE